MRIRLLVILVVFAIISLLSPPPSTTTYALADDCDVVNKICNDMAQMIYDMCVVGGQHTLPQCAEHEAVFRVQCKKDNGCAPTGTD